MYISSVPVSFTEYFSGSSTSDNTLAEIHKFNQPFRQDSVRISRVITIGTFLVPAGLLNCLCFLFAGKKKISLYDSQAPICPICQVLLRPGELQEHMETEIERLASICLRYV